MNLLEAVMAVSGSKAAAFSSPATSAYLGAEEWRKVLEHAMGLHFWAGEAELVVRLPYGRYILTRTLGDGIVGVIASTSNLTRHRRAMENSTKSSPAAPCAEPSGDI